MPDPAGLAEAYRVEYAKGAQVADCADPEWWPSVARTYYAAIVRTLQDHDVRGPVVDCGAGWGGLLSLLLESGFDARGVELSDAQVAYVSGRGLPIQQGDLKTLSADNGRVSVITLMTVFEHLADHDALLQDAHRLLADDGLVVTLHPTAAFFNLAVGLLRIGNRHKELPDWGGAFAAPWHTALLSVEATKSLAARNGLEVIDIRPSPQGRFGGLLGVQQWVLEQINKVGWRLFGTTWPLVTTHIFVFRKISQRS
jgi:SAM-dependent methyltransferase